MADHSCLTSLTSGLPDPNKMAWSSLAGIHKKILQSQCRDVFNNDRALQCFWRTSGYLIWGPSWRTSRILLESGPRARYGNSNSCSQSHLLYCPLIDRCNRDSICLRDWRTSRNQWIDHRGNTFGNHRPLGSLIWAINRAIQYSR